MHVKEVFKVSTACPFWLLSAFQYPFYDYFFKNLNLFDSQGKGRVGFRVCSII